LIEDDAIIRAGCVNRSSTVVQAVVVSRRCVPVVLRRQAPQRRHNHPLRQWCT